MGTARHSRRRFPDVERGQPGDEQHEVADFAGGYGLGFVHDSLSGTHRGSPIVGKQPRRRNNPADRPQLDHLVVAPVPGVGAGQRSPPAHDRQRS